MARGYFLHEELERTPALMARIAELPVTICGAGALGANLVETLARTGFGKLRVIDRDRVEERNLSTQPWLRADVGSPKARILANALYRAVGVSIDARAEELTPQNARKLLDGSALVVDTFDNSGSRGAVKDACAAAGLPCLHAGMADAYAEVIWSERYRVPSAARDDVCDYPLARTLALMTVVVTTEAIVAFARSGERRSFTLTLGDLAVRPY